MKCKMQYIYLLCLFCALSSCSEDAFRSYGEGKGRLLLGGVKIEMEAQTRAFSLPIPGIEDVTIDIIDPLGNIIKTGRLSDYQGETELFPATYTLKAYYGTKAQMSVQPYFEGSTTFTIAEEIVTNVDDVTVSLANSVIVPVIPADLIVHYQTAPTFYVTLGDQKRAVASGTALYILPGIAHKLTLEGINQVGVSETKILSEAFVGEAKKVYNLNCKGVLVLPDQTGGAWSKRLYITPIKVQDASGNMVELQNVEYEALVASSFNWDDSFKASKDDNGNWIITGLSEATEYKVRARIGSLISNEQTVTTEKEVKLSDLVDSGLETWTSEKLRDAWTMWYVRNGNSESTEGWCTLNKKTTADDDLRAYCSNSGTERTEDRHGGSYAAEIKTIGWGSGNTAAGGWSKIKNITPGELFLGTVIGNVPNYYYTFNVRPKEILFYCKYQPKKDRKYTATCRVYDKNKTLIAEGTISEGGVSSYTLKKIVLTYKVYNVKAEYISLIFSSGENVYDELDKGSVSNSARHTGNKLYIDDVELVYE